ncbi:MULTISPECIES: hypothetical protein [Roseomonadaceae]|uniref:Uncharacterized protein n=1 Tax=Falsiroseomonas oleicola TaxID=2801474 RepID=A0ABS6HFS7_9PROT|nr:hypothetical protein [Roseomonas oleicola]MBU8546145.1 hypothetical protein [Roseomonas oleicola]
MQRVGGELFEQGKIILLCVVAVCVYGIMNNLITVRILPEFFAIFGANTAHVNPNQIAFFFGVIATWWVGAVIGVVLAISARAGSRPRISAVQLVKPLIYCLVAVGALACLAGFSMYGLSVNVELPRQYSPYISSDKANAFWVVNAIHTVDYVAGLLAGVLLCSVTYGSRRHSPSNFRAVPENRTEDAQNIHDPNLRVKTLLGQSLPWPVQGVFFSVACTLLFLAFYYIPPGVITACLTVTIGAYAIWLILDPRRRYIRMASAAFGVWAANSAIPKLSGFLNARGFNLGFSIDGDPGWSFHFASFAIIAVLVAAQIWTDGKQDVQ